MTVQRKKQQILIQKMVKPFILSVVIGDHYSKNSKNHEGQVKGKQGNGP
jgi:hypothetical protein